MQDCCNTDDSPNRVKVKKWFNWIILLIILGLTSVAVIQHLIKISK